MHKVKYLDGLRGLASLMVAISHFLLAFYPATFTGQLSQAHINFNNIESFFSYSVISVFTNGNFAVYIFFVMSGFVLSRKYFSKNDPDILIESAVKRYLRLFIPVFTTIVISYICIKLGFYFNKEAALISKSDFWLGRFWNFVPDIKYTLFSAFVGVFFYGNQFFSTTMWTMNAEFFGSMLVFSMLALTHNLRKRWLIYLFLTLIFLKYGNYYNISFIGGVVLSQYFESIIEWGKSRISFLPIVALFIVSFIAGGYPSKLDLSGTIYASLGTNSFLNSFDLFHMIGAVALLSAVLVSPTTHRFLASKPLIFLGDISFSLYLIHPIILGSFSSWLLIHLQSLGYNHCMLVIFPVTLLVMFFLSYLMTVTVDRLSLSLPKKMYLRFFKSAPLG